MTGPRIYVVGNSGSGKSTFARDLAARRRVPHVELDAMFHQPGWTELADDEFQRRVREAVAADGWVVDGNYALVRPIVLERATTIVWLDFSRPVVMRRVIGRSVSRAITRRELWNGNRERARFWFRRDHPMRWAWSQHHRKRVEYQARFASAECAHLEIVRLRVPPDAARWLAAQ